MAITFDILPIEAHQAIQSYLNVTDTIAVSHCSAGLLDIYRPFSFRSVTVFRQNVPVGSYLMVYSKDRVISSEILANPRRYSWFLSNKVNFITIKPEIISRAEELVSIINDINLKIDYPLLRAINVGQINNQFQLGPLFISPKSINPDCIIEGLYRRLSANRYPLLRLAPQFCLNFLLDHLLLEDFCSRIEKLDVLSHPPLPYLLPFTSLKVLRYHLRESPKHFSQVVEELPKCCPNLDTLITSHSFELKNSLLFTDKCYRYLVKVPSHIKCVIYLESDHTHDNVCNPPKVFQVRELHISKSESFHCLQLYALFPKLTSLYIDRFLRYLAPLCDMLTSPIFGGISLRNIQSLAIEYSPECFERHPWSFDVVAKHLKNLKSLEVVFGGLFSGYIPGRSPCSWDFLLFPEVLNTLRQVRETIWEQPGISESELDSIIHQRLGQGLDIEMEIDKCSVARIFRNIILHPTPETWHLPDLDGQAFGLSCLSFLKKFQLLEYFISCISNFAALEYLTLKQYDSLSVQLQCLFQNTTTSLKQIQVEYVPYLPLHILKNNRNLPVFCGDNHLLLAKPVCGDEHHLRFLVDVQKLRFSKELYNVDDYQSTYTKAPIRHDRLVTI